MGDRVVEHGKVLRALTVAGIAAVACLATPAAAPAAETLYASPGALAGRPCSEDDPCQLEDAIDEAADGDTVSVGPGEYRIPNGGLEIETEISIGGAVGSARPLLETETGAAVQITPEANATIHDLTIAGKGPLQLESGIGERLYVSYYGEESPVAETPGACLIRLSDITTTATLRDSVCWANELVGPTIGNAVGISVGSEGPEKVVHLRNVTAIAAGEVGEKGEGSNGIEAFSAGSARLLVNARGVIARSVNGTDVVAAIDKPDVFSLVNFTLSNSNFATARGGADDVKVTAPDTNGNQSAAPLFVEPAFGDFHEAEGSPTLDAGAEDEFTGPVDLDGIARSQPKCLGPEAQAIPDAGAYERVATAKCPPRPPEPPPPPEPFKPRFRILKLTINKRTGAGSVQIEVPSAGIASVTGSGIKFLRRNTAAAGTVTIPIQPWAITLVRLNKFGKTRVKVKVRFEPKSGGPSKQVARSLILKRNRKPR